MVSAKEERLIIEEFKKQANLQRSMCIACGAAAKLMREAGYTKSQFIKMMDSSWEIMIEGAVRI